ncbi:MAG: glycosyltransferase [Bacteroidales bacterium]
MADLVSVIVLTYNSGKYVVETLESIKAVNYSPLELVISDDCSSDDTLSLCQNWIDNNSWRFENVLIASNSVNAGIPANCNQGIKISTGTWIKFIAGDDLLIEDSIQHFIKEVHGPLEGEMVFHGRLRSFGEQEASSEDYSDWGDPLSQDFNRAGITAAQQFEILLRFCPVSGPTTFINRKVFEKTGPFDERFRFWEDRPMWLKITSAGFKFNFVDRDVVFYRVHEGSVQKNQGNIFFSRTQLSKDEGSKIIILPYLPPFERILSSYILSVRKMILKISGNRKTLPLNLIYKTLVKPADLLIRTIRKKYSP